MARTTDTREILNDAVAALARVTGLRATIEDRRDKNAALPAHVGTHAPTLRIARQGREHAFQADIVPWLTATTPGLLLEKHPRKQKWILVTRFIPPTTAARMRENGIQYLDTAGNAFLEAKDLFVFVKGERRAEPREALGLGRPFQPAGMQVIFALLCNPGLEQMPYRDIATAAGTALGTVTGTLQDLRRMGHLLELKETGRRVVRRDALFDKWVAAFPHRFKQKLFLGRFAAPGPEWWRTADLAGLRALWGGETAAAMETGYLTPEVATLYLETPPNELVARFRLRRDPRGQVELYKKFWRFRTTEQLPLVPAPLTYADLLATEDDRNLQTAKILREKNLGQYLR